MIAPRNRTDHVPAPVLFRLPHLQTHVAANPAELDPPQPSAADEKSPHNTRLEYRDWLTKPPVMLGAMLVVACGSWFAGRQMSAPPAVDTTIAAAPATEPTADQPPLPTTSDQSAAAETSPSPTSDATLVQQPALADSGAEVAVVAENAEDFYLPEDVPTPELPAVATTPDTDPSGTSELAAAPATDGSAAERFAELSADVLNQPTEAADVTEVAASEPAAPPETQPEPAAAAPASTELASATPAAEPAAAPAEAESTPPAETEGKKLRRVLSRTPHDIPDWSKYLTGANSPIKAASAPGYESNGTTQPKHERAFYYEQD